MNAIFIIYYLLRRVYIFGAKFLDIYVIFLKLDTIMIIMNTLCNRSSGVVTIEQEAGNELWFQVIVS